MASAQPNAHSTRNSILIVLSCLGVWGGVWLLYSVAATHPRITSKAGITLSDDGEPEIVTMQCGPGTIASVRITEAGRATEVWSARKLPDAVGVTTLSMVDPGTGYETTGALLEVEPSVPLEVATLKSTNGYGIGDSLLEFRVRDLKPGQMITGVIGGEDTLIYEPTAQFLHETPVC